MESVESCNQLCPEETWPFKKNNCIDELIIYPPFTLHTFLLTFSPMYLKFMVEVKFETGLLHLKMLKKFNE